MSVEVRVPEEKELPAVFDQLSRIFSGRPTDPERVERSLALTERERTLVATDGGRLVGTAGIFSLGMTVPGGREVRTAGITRVSVAATHRRRGVLRELMRRQLDDIHQRGEPLAALYASQAPIYGRFGYGVGTWHCHLAVPRARSAFGEPAPAGGLRILTSDEALALLPGLYERWRTGQPGAITRSEAYWKLRVTEPADPRQDRSAPWFLLHDGDRGPDGYAIYQVQARWQQEDPAGTIFVGDLVGLDAGATAALWRYCLDLDLMSRTEAHSCSLEDPLRHLLADPRAARTTVYDGVWLRLVDVGAALGSRAYSTQDALTIEVHDGFCPWNAGRWRLEDGCRRTDSEPDLVVDAADLAATYLGGNSWTAMAAAGRVEERT
ncbi:MAG TPA: GNAT family N-acetyltransferase, partial [Candidatus Dormibacteraeota bacterium]